MIPFNLKLFLLTVLLGATLEAYIGTTYAVFTATTHVSGNVFSTGTWTTPLGSAGTSGVLALPDNPTLTPTPKVNSSPTDTPVPSITVMPSVTETITPTLAP